MHKTYKQFVGCRKESLQFSVSASFLSLSPLISHHCLVVDYSSTQYTRACLNCDRGSPNQHIHANFANMDDNHVHSPRTVDAQQSPFPWSLVGRVQQASTHGKVWQRRKLKI